MSVIEWRHDGRRPLLPVLILPPAVHDLRSVEALALVDTDATTSGITAELAGAFDLPVMGKRAMSFGNADMQVERYVFRIAFASGAAAPAFPFVFSDVEGFRLRSAFPFKVILGMDVLGQCDFTMRRDGHCSIAFG